MLDIGDLMQLWTGEAGFGNRTGTSEELVFDNEAEGRSESAMVWLARYASKTWCLLTLVLPSSTASTPAPGDAITQDKSDAITPGQ